MNQTGCPRERRQTRHQDQGWGWGGTGPAVQQWQMDVLLHRMQHSPLEKCTLHLYGGDMDIVSGDSGTLGSPLGLWMLDEEASSLIDNEMFHLKSCPRLVQTKSFSNSFQPRFWETSRAPPGPGATETAIPPTFLWPSPSGQGPAEPSLPRYLGSGADSSSGCQICQHSFHYSRPASFPLGNSF